MFRFGLRSTTWLEAQRSCRPSPRRRSPLHRRVRRRVAGLGMAGGCRRRSREQRRPRPRLERAAVRRRHHIAGGGTFGGGTAVQEATGHADSAEEMEKYLTAVSADPDPEKIHAYRQGSVEHSPGSKRSASSFERSYYSRKGRHPAPDPGPDAHRQREGVAVPRHRGPCPAWPLRCPPGDTGGASLVIELLVKKLPNSASRSGMTGARQPAVDDEGRSRDGVEVPEAFQASSAPSRSSSQPVDSSPTPKWWPRTSPRWPRSRTRWAPPTTTASACAWVCRWRATARHGSDLRHCSHLSARQHGRGRDRRSQER